MSTAAAASQAFQIAGALLVLAGYGLSQARVLDPRSVPYLALNLVGSGILAVLALLDRQWGFLLLEGVWALISLAGTIGALRGKKPEAASG